MICIISQQCAPVTSTPLLQQLSKSSRSIEVQWPCHVSTVAVHTPYILRWFIPYPPSQHAFSCTFSGHKNGMVNRCVYVHCVRANACFKVILNVKSAVTPGLKIQQRRSLLHITDGESIQIGKQHGDHVVQTVLVDSKYFPRLIRVFQWYRVKMVHRLHISFMNHQAQNGITFYGRTTERNGNVFLTTTVCHII